MHLFRRNSKNPLSNIVRIGNREIITRGLNSGFWTDLYHRSMTVSWPVFFASAALVFIALNGTFALVLFLGHEPIANVPTGSFLDLVYFSIETLATVGYGDMHPQTHFGHVVATVEIFTGMSLLAVMTGLIFARFSRPARAHRRHGPGTSAWLPCGMPFNGQCCLGRTSWITCDVAAAIAGT
jgi:inward rectifier potassium channel